MESFAEMLKLYRLICLHSLELEMPAIKKINNISFPLLKVPGHAHKIRYYFSYATLRISNNKYCNCHINIMHTPPPAKVTLQRFTFLYFIVQQPVHEFLMHFIANKKKNIYC